MPTLRIFILFMTILSAWSAIPAMAASKSAKATPVVVQLTRSADNFGHRRALLQIDRVLDDIGENKLKITVVAYEEGIHALLADNNDTAHLLTKLANRGVTFKACKISMRAWELNEAQFPLEVQFVPAGAPEVMRFQLQGAKYWAP